MKGETTYHLEEFPWKDDEIDVVLDIEYEATKGLRGSKYGGPDGLGWPPEPAELNVFSIEAVGWEGEAKKELEEAIWNDKGLLRDIEEKCLRELEY
jgi:hypothetical protein